jgi:hypothetical protein
MTTPSKRALDVLLHATGTTRCLRDPSLEPGWRNRYTSSPGCDGYDAVTEAVAAGWMEQLRPSSVTEHACFRATADGLRVARAHLVLYRPARWKVATSLGTAIVYAATRSKARYAYALEIKDARGCTTLEALREIQSVRRVTL